MIVFNERQYVENLLNGSKDGKALSFYDLSRTISYFRYIIGKSRKQAVDDLMDFCNRNNPYFNYSTSRKRIKAALVWSDSYKLRKTDPIWVRQSEMDKILNTFDDYRYQKVLFWLLIASQHFSKKDHHVNEPPPSKYDGRYFYNFGLPQAFKYSEVYVNRNQRYLMLHQLQQGGMIDTTFHGTFEVLFIDKNSENFRLIEDLENIMSYFPYYCNNCGKEYEWKRSGKNQLCDECYEKKRIVDKWVSKTNKNIESND